MRSLFTPIFLLTCALAGAAANAQEVQPFPGRLIAENEPVEKRPWVGVSVAPAPASLRHQLKVEEGVGLVVEFVQPGSPAADAGIKPFDLLLKLDDQWLINPEQFAVLVRMHHAGDVVKVTYLREGGERTAPVKLVEHEAARLPEWDGNFAWSNPPQPPQPPQPPRLRPPHGPGGAFGQTTITWLDGQRQMSVITTSDGHRTLQVKENDSGKVLFNGPIDTEEQRQKLPPDIRHALADLDRLTSELEARQGLGGGGERPAPAAPSPSTRPAEPHPPGDGGADPQDQAP